MENHIRFPENLCYEDNYFMVLALLHCKTMYQISRCLYHYRENPHSTVMSHNTDRLFDRLEIEELKIEEFKRLGIFEHFYKEIMLDFFELYYCNTLVMMAVRSEKPSYAAWLHMKEKMLSYFPDYRLNNELMQSQKLFWQVMIRTLECHWDEASFLEFMTDLLDAFF